MNTSRFFKPYAWAMIVAGAVVFVGSAFGLPYGRLDLRFAAIAAATLLITARISIRIPQFNSEISVSDTFVFLTLLLYGGEAAVLLASAECLLSARRFCKTWFMVVFNAAVMALATFITVSSLRLVIGDGLDISQGLSSSLFYAVCLMTLVQYAANSGLIALGGALKYGKPFVQTWHRHYLWTSITYVVGAYAAGVIALLTNIASDYAILATAPIIVVVYFTYRTYLLNVETSARQAEQAQRHVEELSRYIAEQDRIAEQFAQMEKMSALGELASGVAHDFNNTLAGILGRAQLLTRTDDLSKIRSGLQIIIQAASDGAKTVCRIQDFARQRRAHDFAPVSVDQLLLDASEITRPRWKTQAEAAGVRIRFELRQDSGATVLGDESELREVLVNMIFNAVDAMPAGGNLTLSSSARDDEVELCVSDTGTGMPADVRSRIFDPFFTTKGKSGLGLGLAVSYGIVSRHGGGIEVESEPGRGTTFRIKLSASVGASAQSVQESVQPNPFTRESGERIDVLVVEDEESVRQLISEILETEGHGVVLASNGHEGLVRFRAGTFDAVFTDIGMPGMSGWELARAIRRQDPDIPLAVITGWGEAVGSDEQSAAKIDWVVTKPFNAERIAEIARDVSAKRHGEASGASVTVAA